MYRISVNKSFLLNCGEPAKITTNWVGLVLTKQFHVSCLQCWPRCEDLIKAIQLERT